MDQFKRETERRDDRAVATYEQPTVVDYGDLTELTAGKATGRFLDASFPAGTQFGDLTFS